MPQPGRVIREKILAIYVSIFMDACTPRGAGKNKTCCQGSKPIMPIYEYQCPKCGRVFEEWVKSSEAHKDEPCPDCGTDSPRIMSRTSFVLKGDGWYVSDYGYRKGITEDNDKSAPPAHSTPVTPAAQGEKSVAPRGERSIAKKESAPPAATAPKPAPGAGASGETKSTGSSASS